MNEDDCWLWQAATYSNGYGTFYLPKELRTITHKTTGAHIFSYLLENGYDSVPPGKVVCHTCDNPPCVNPAHLFVGTHLDNIMDKINKGRHVSNPRYQRGEANCTVKVSESQVRELRNLHHHGLSIAEASKRVGIDRRNGWAIVHRKSWTHL